MIAPEEDEDEHVYGSALDPSSLHHKGDKEIAKPNVKVEVKVNNRAIEGGAKEETIKQEEKVKKGAAHQIWSEQEVNEKAEEAFDDRLQPEYEIM